MSRVWLNGEMVSEEDACVPAGDRGFLLGDGLFETMAVFNARVFDLNAHLARLQSGLDVLGFAQKVDMGRLRTAIGQYIAVEGAAHAVLRLTVTRGAGPRGLMPPEAPSPTILMTLSPMPPQRAPVSLYIAAATRRNDHSPLSRLKALAYLDNMLALAEAHAQGADDTLILNTRGVIACASVANVFVLVEGRLATPPVSDGALPGTMRALVLSLARAAGLMPTEASLSPGDISLADEVFLTNSIGRIVEAKTCNGIAIGQRAGRAIERLRALIAQRIDTL